MTNRVSTYTYDNNGNVVAMPQMTLEYDVDNRLTRATHQTNGVDECVYGPAGQRLMKNGVITLYGIDGKRLGNYTLGMVGSFDVIFAFRSVDYLGLNPPQQMWFAGRPLDAVDRVGSRSTGGRFTPYGVEVTPSANDAEKFATYYRDQRTELDYAMQRYYQSGLGRFVTPDPYMATAEGANDPATPQS